MLANAPSPHSLLGIILQKEPASQGAAFCHSNHVWGFWVTWLSPVPPLSAHICFSFLHEPLAETHGFPLQAACKDSFPSLFLNLSQSPQPPTILIRVWLVKAALIATLCISDICLYHTIPYHTLLLISSLGGVFLFFFLELWLLRM